MNQGEAYGFSVDLALPTRLKMAKGNARIQKVLANGLEILSPPTQRDEPAGPT